MRGPLRWTSDNKDADTRQTGTSASIQIRQPPIAALFDLADSVGKRLAIAIPPAMAPRASAQADLYVYARGKIEFHQGVYRLLGRLNDIHQPLVGPDLVLIPRILVHVR